MGVRTANVQDGNIGETLTGLAEVIHGRREASPEQSYTARLLQGEEDELLKKIAEEYRVPAAGILVIHDELELPAGAVALKMGGGHGGHNGLRSIGEKLGTPDYPRVRCGIGRPPGKMAPADYVLQQLRGRDWEEFEVTAADAALAARFALEQGVAAALAKYPAKK